MSGYVQDKLYANERSAKKPIASHRAIDRCVLFPGRWNFCWHYDLYASSIPGGNVSDQVVRAVDIARPAIVRIITSISGHLDVQFPSGQTVTFPQGRSPIRSNYPVPVPLLHLMEISLLLTML